MWSSQFSQVLLLLLFQTRKLFHIPVGAVKFSGFPLLCIYWHSNPRLSNTVIMCWASWQREWLVEHFTLTAPLWQAQKWCAWKNIYQEAFGVFLGPHLKQFSGWKARERRASSLHGASNSSRDSGFGSQCWPTPQKLLGSCQQLRSGLKHLSYGTMLLLLFASLNSLSSC